MSPKQDRLFHISIIALLIVYAIGGQLAALGGSIGFPRFDVSSINIPTEIKPSHYELKLLAVNNEPLSEPIYFADANNWIDNAQSKAARNLISQIGIAVYAEDEAKFNLLKSELEATYFGKLVSAEYEVVFRAVGVESYAPNDRFVDQIIGQFEFSRILTMK